MEARRFQGALELLLVMGFIAAGLAWRECLLPAIGSVLAWRLFLLRMDRGAPWPALRAALDAVSAGALVAATGVLLLIGVGLTWFEWWQPSAPHPWPTLVSLGLAAAGCSLARGGPLGFVAELRAWMWLFVGVLLALAFHRAGWSVAPCALVASVGIVMVWIGWQLAAVTGMGLLRSAG